MDPHRAKAQLLLRQPLLRRRCQPRRRPPLPQVLVVPLHLLLLRGRTSAPSSVPSLAGQSLGPPHRPRSFRSSSSSSMTPGSDLTRPAPRACMQTKTEQVKEEPRIPGRWLAKNPDVN